nr:hypothetical protein [Tanacetum cinerariifolium]
MMDDPNITIDEYIKLQAEKAQRRRQTFNWETATYGKSYCEDLDFFIDFKADYPAIVYNDALTSNVNVPSKQPVSIYNAIKADIDFSISFSDSDNEEYNSICDKKSFSYKLIHVNDLKPEPVNDHVEINTELCSKNIDINKIDSVVCIRFKITFDIYIITMAGSPQIWLNFNHRNYSRETKKAYKEAYNTLKKKDTDGPEALSFADFSNVNNRNTLLDVDEFCRGLCMRGGLFFLGLGIGRFSAREKVTIANLFYFHSMNRGMIVPWQVAKFLADKAKALSVVTRGQDTALYDVVKLEDLRIVKFNGVRLAEMVDEMLDNSDEEAKAAEARRAQGEDNGDQVSILAKVEGIGHKCAKVKSSSVKNLLLYATTFKFTRDDLSELALRRSIGDKLTINPFHHNLFQVTITMQFRDFHTDHSKNLLHKVDFMLGEFVCLRSIPKLTLVSLVLDPLFSIFVISHFDVVYLFFGSDDFRNYISLLKKYLAAMVRRPKSIRVAISSSNVSGSFTADTILLNQGRSDLSDLEVLAGDLPLDDSLEVDDLFDGLDSLLLELMLLKRPKENTKCVSAAGEELTTTRHS